jgi:hypothetical protein
MPVSGAPHASMGRRTGHQTEVLAVLNVLALAERDIGHTDTELRTSSMPLRLYVFS